MNLSKYAVLGQFLNSVSVREITLTFAEVEEILGFELPPSARRGKGFWINTVNDFVPPCGPGWVSVGWRVVSRDVEKEMVTFEKVVE